MQIGGIEIRNPLKPLVINHYNSKSEGEKFWLTVEMNIALIFLICVFAWAAINGAKFAGQVIEIKNRAIIELNRPYVLSCNITDFTSSLKLHPPSNCSCPSQVQSLPGTSSASPSN